MLLRRRSLVPPLRSGQALSPRRRISATHRLRSFADAQDGTARTPGAHPVFATGAAALITVLILMTTALAVATGMGFLALSESTTSEVHVRGSRAFYGVESCVEEALRSIRQAASPTFPGGTYAVGTSCTATATNAGSGIWDISATGTVGPVTRRITARVSSVTITLSGRTLTDLSVDSWSEVTQ